LLYRLGRSFNTVRSGDCLPSRPRAILITKTKTRTKMIAIRLLKLKLELKYSKNYNYIKTILLHG